MTGLTFCSCSWTVCQVAASTSTLYFSAFDTRSILDNNRYHNSLIDPGGLVYMDSTACTGVVVVFLAVFTHFVGSVESNNALFNIKKDHRLTGKTMVMPF